MPQAHLDVGALYGALDARRRSKKLSWREVAKQIGVSPSTFTRMAQGKRPDVNSFAALVEWLGMQADRFLTSSDSRRSTKKVDTMAMVSTYLRADRELDKRSVEFLEELLQAAMKRLKEEA